MTPRPRQDGYVRVGSYRPPIRNVNPYIPESRTRNVTVTYIRNVQLRTCPHLFDLEHLNADSALKAELLT